MKPFATALLLAAAVVFLVTRVFEDDYGWLAPIRAMAEAAMVGALADWFAVTALFRHPLGLPIPHTAIIPANKDRIGRSLGDFVQQELPRPRPAGPAGRRRRRRPPRRRLAGRAGQRPTGRRHRRHLPRRRGRRARRRRGLGRPPARHRRPGCRATPAAPLLATRAGGRPRGGPPPRPRGRRAQGRRRSTSTTTATRAPQAARDRVAVVGARADRRPHLRQDLRRRPALRRRPLGRPATTSCAATSTRAWSPRRPPAHRSRAGRPGRGAARSSCSPTPPCRRGRRRSGPTLKAELAVQSRDPSSALRTRLDPRWRRPGPASATTRPCRPRRRAGSWTPCRASPCQYGQSAADFIAATVERWDPAETTDAWSCSWAATCSSSASTAPSSAASPGW